MPKEIYMKTIKIENDTHKKLLSLKAQGGFKTINQTISHILKWVLPEEREYKFDDK